MEFSRCSALRVSLTCIIAAGSVGAGRIASAQSDPVIFSFATVGDSRQDPASPDPTTLIANPTPTTTGGAPSVTGVLLPQDKQFLQNSAAWDVIQAGIQAQGPNMLFFNGDMIYGYGRPILPSAWAGTQPGSWTTAQMVVPDTIYEYVQYAYWRGSISNLFFNNIYVIPVPGNHETQCSYSAAPYSSGSSNPNCNTKTQGNLTGKTAYADNENAFRANVGDLIQDLTTNYRFSNVTGFFATNVTGLTAATAPGPSTTACTPLGVTSNGSCVYSAGTPGNNGPITDTQEMLDYSFDIPIPGPSGPTGAPLLLHFAVINTDPSGSDATAPSDWLAGDLAAAAARGSAAGAIVKYFVFGHKPAFTYDYTVGGSVAYGASNPGPGGLDDNTIVGAADTYRNLFWAVIAQYNATYFSGHEHIPNVQRFADPTGVSKNTPFQVIVGSGGSPFDDKEPSPGTEPVKVAPTDRYYGWALVSVHQSGNVTLSMTGFPDTSIAFGGPTQDMMNYDVPGPVPGTTFATVPTLQ
jgi:hypothetical protein